MRLAPTNKNRLALRQTAQKAATARRDIEADVEDAKSRLLRAMTTIAVPVAGSPASELPKKRHKSRFFFVPNEIQLEIDMRKKQVEGSRRRTTIQDETGKRASSYKVELEPVVQKNVDKVREFFLKEINPLLLAAQLGSAQAIDVTQTTLEAQVDHGPHSYFESILRKAAQAKLDKFVAEYIGIDIGELRGKSDKPQPINSPRRDEGAGQKQKR